VSSKPPNPNFPASTRDYVTYVFGKKDGDDWLTTLREFGETRVLTDERG
jgi:hypothetical protein